jgi:gag-polypeptide of LTR copia-type
MEDLIAAKSAEITIRNLDTTNYRKWNELIEETLDSRGIEGYIRGSVKKPTTPGQLQIWFRNQCCHD